MTVESGSFAGQYSHSDAFANVMNHHESTMNQIASIITEATNRFAQNRDSNSAQLGNLQTTADYSPSNSSLSSLDCRRVITGLNTHLETMNSKLQEMLSHPPPAFQTDQSYRLWRGKVQTSLVNLVSNFRQTNPYSDRSSLNQQYAFGGSAANTLFHINEIYNTSTSFPGTDKRVCDDVAMMAALACEEVASEYLTQIKTVTVSDEASLPGIPELAESDTSSDTHSQGTANWR